MTTQLLKDVEKLIENKMLTPVGDVLYIMRQDQTLAAFSFVKENDKVFLASPEGLKLVEANALYVTAQKYGKELFINNVQPFLTQLLAVVEKQQAAEDGE